MSKRFTVEPKHLDFCPIQVQTLGEPLPQFLMGAMRIEGVLHVATVVGAPPMQLAISVEMPAELARQIDVLMCTALEMAAEELQAGLRASDD